MKKRKVKKLTIEWDNDEKDEFEVDATFSESFNSRKKAGFTNLQEWVEYHITWVTYVRDLPAEPEPKPVEVPTGVRAEDYLDDPTFVGIEYGRPKFVYCEYCTPRKLYHPRDHPRTQFNFDDFGLDEIFGSSNGV